MAYSTMSDYGNAANRSTLRKYIHQLEELGRVEVVSSNVIDLTRSEVEGRAHHKPNIYRIKKALTKTPTKKF